MTPERKFTHGTSGYTLGCRCDTCCDVTRAYKQRRNQRRYEAGQCRHCNEAREPDSVTCGGCLKVSRLYQRKYNAKRRRAYVRGGAADMTAGRAL